MHKRTVKCIFIFSYSNSITETKIQFDSAKINNIVVISILNTDGSLLNWKTIIRN